MNTNALEGLAHLSAGLGALMYGSWLCQPALQTPVYAAFARLLVGVGLAVALKGAAWLLGAQSPEWLMQGALVGLSLFPLLAALFVEQLRHRHLPLWAKLYFLLGGVSFALMSLLPSCVALRSWNLALTFYLVGGVLILLVWLLRGWLKTEPGPRRALLGGVLVACMVAPLFIVSDLRTELGLEMPRMASVPLLLLLFYGSEGLHRVGVFQLRRASYRLLLLLSLAGATSLLCREVAALDSAQTWCCAVVLALVLLLLEPMRGLLRQQQVQRSDLLFERLSLLPSHPPEALLRALQGWPELSRVTLLSLAECSWSERQRLHDWRLAHGGLIEKSVVAREQWLTREPERLLTLEQLLLLLDSHGVDYAVPWNDDQLLGLELETGADRRLYGPVLKVIGGLAQHAAQPLTLARSTS